MWAPDAHNFKVPDESEKHSKAVFVVKVELAGDEARGAYFAARIQIKSFRKACDRSSAPEPRIQMHLY
jgi:hypothetical protein